jgi:hypothetical protein
MRNEVTDSSAAKLKPCSPSNAILQTPVKRQTAIKTQANFVCRATTKDTLLLPLTSTGFYLDGNSPGKYMENSGKQNAKMGFKSPPSR